MDKFNFKNYDYKRSLIFCGPTGTGKTYQAKKILDSYEKGKLNTYEISDGQFKQMVKSNMLCLRSDKDREVSIMMYPLEMMIRCKILLFDDIGVSDATDAYLRDLTFVIDERIKKGLVTIFTTNLSKEELSQKLNERIVSRMLFDADIVLFSGEDKRMQNTKIYSSS